MALAATVVAWPTTVTRAGTVGRVDLDTLRVPVYTVDGDAFVRHNGDRFNNRPLYCNHIPAAALGGDKPYATLGGGKCTLGNLMLALKRDGHAKWLHEASDVTSAYHPDHMEWTVRDAAWGDQTVVHLDLVPAADGIGMAARARVEGGRAGDQLIWASGGVAELRERFLYRFDVTTAGREKLTLQEFAAGDCAGNEVHVTGDAWTIGAGKRGAAAASGRCSVASGAVVADADAFTDPATLPSSHGGARPIVCGVIPIGPSPADIYWSLHGSTNGTPTPVDAPSADFAAGLERARAVGQRVVVDTPDPWFNAAVGASSAVMDGLYRDGMYTHAGMRWSVPLIGWRSMFGATAYGWHDRVLAEAGKCLAKQITQSDKVAPHADPDRGLASQASDSRMFGVGRVAIDQPEHYDMQSLFFDQLQHAWRWTGDADLGRLLRPALELHCRYLRECFDPSGTGIYESYANTWPTDDQWYNGGGTSEETAYACRAEQAALDLAKRAGDAPAVAVHEATLAKIRQAFLDRLWATASGHPGAYREQGGLQRLHESCWLYGVFCPIDAGLLDPFQAAQALHYTEWALERIKLPYGGEQCWPSNWVPSVWSVREMWPGDNYQLALAYFQTGLPEGGWTVLRGTFPEHMLFGTVPGDLGHPAGGTDFADCASPFCRTVVEGLFGYDPDYPAGVVRVAPQFPEAWDHAAIHTPDMSLSFQRNASVTTYEIGVTQAAAMDVRVPVSASGIERVTVDGKPVTWELMPGFGRSIVKVAVPAATHARIEVTTRDPRPTYPAVEVRGDTGDRVTLSTADGAAVAVRDPQGVLASATVNAGAVVGTLTANAGDHMVFVVTRVGDTTQWRQFKIHVTDAAGDAAEAASHVDHVPADVRWQTVDMRKALNADVRTVFQQRYLSPRPNTCSLRLATDGYNTWQSILDPKVSKVPVIGLEQIPSLLDGEDRIRTSDRVPFAWGGDHANIAFTSRWDNWPVKVDVPVHRRARAAYFLLCGTTNPMEVRIANAVLRLRYADGVEDRVEVVPPFNFWSLCPFVGIDYDYGRDGFSLPKVRPATVQLGKNCRAVVLNRRLRAGVELASVQLETQSTEVVIGLAGVTLMNPD